MFTLGLTEGWRAKADGAVLPLPPGVAGGAFDETAYEFVDFEVEEVTRGLALFVRALRAVNRRSRIILTVSPVQLVATFENRHVLVSTVLSKSVLRVAVDKISRRFPRIDYFPNYEIITGPHAGGRYDGDELQSITPAGVAHAMGCVLSHHARRPKSAAPDVLDVAPS